MESLDSSHCEKCGVELEQRAETNGTLSRRNTNRYHSTGRDSAAKRTAENIGTGAIANIPSGTSAFLQKVLLYAIHSTDCQRTWHDGTGSGGKTLSFEKETKRSKEIVRDNGVLRYIGDKYLCINYDLAGEEPKHRPPKKMPSRTEAQWFMVSDIASSYGEVAKSLMDKIEKDGNSSKEVDDLLDFAIKKQTEYINRGYARITGKGSYKANGVKAPVYQVPEAYQAVTDSKGNIKFVPGAHTPLAWAQASLYDASKNFMDNLERYSELKNEL